MEFPRPSWMTIKRWSLRCLASLLALCLVVVLLLIYLLGTESGRKFGLQKGLGFLPENLHVSIDGLQTSSLGEWRGTRLHLIHNNETLLILDDFILKFDTRALLDKHFHLYSLEGRRLEIKLPETSEQELPDPDEKKPLRFSLPENFPQVSVENISFDHLQIERSLQKAQVSKGKMKPADQTGKTQNNDSYVPLFPSSSLHASGYWHSQKPLELTLSLKALHEDAFEINIQSRLKPESSEAHIQLDVKEAAGGYLGQQIKLPESQELDAQMTLVHQLNGGQHKLQLLRLDFPLFNRRFHAEGAMNIIAGESVFDEITLSVLVNQSPLINVSGNVRDNVLDLNLLLNELQLDLLHAWLPQLPTGSVNGKASLTGKTESLKVATELEGNVHYQNEHVQFKTNLDYQNQTLNIHQLSANSERMRASLAGDVNISTSALNVDFDFKAIPLDRISRFFPDIVIPVEALKAESLAGKITGFYNDLNALSGELETQLSGRYGDAPLSLNARARKSGKQVQVEDLQLDALQGKAMASGTLNAETYDVDFDVQTRSFNLQALELVNIALPDSLQATINADLKIRGDVRKPFFEFKADALGQYQDVDFNLSALAHARETDIQIQSFTLKAFDEKIIDLHGKLNQENIQMNLVAGNVPAKLFQAFGWYENIGKMSADLQINASLNKDKKLKNLVFNGDMGYLASFNVYDQQGEKKTLPFDWKIQFETKDEQLIVSSRLDSLETEGGRLRAIFPLSPYLRFINSQNPEIKDFPLQLSVEGDTRLRIFSLMVDPDIHRFSGEVHSVLKLEGTLADPYMSGNLEILDSAYENTVTGTVLRNAVCKFNARGHEVNIRDCHANDGFQGKFNLNGEFELAGLVPSMKINNSESMLDLQKHDRLNLELEVEKANLFKYPGVEMLATGNLGISGSMQELLAKGNIEISPLTAFIDETEWGASIPELNVEEVYEEQDESITKAAGFVPPKVLLDITISTHHQAWLRGRGLEAELEGDIKIRGTTQDVRYEGEFKTVRGSMEFFGKKFILETGVVNFVNNSVLISLPAVYEKDGITIRALVTGTGDKISVELSSTPPMPEDEILAYIIFGKAIKKMTALEALQVANAVQKLRGSSSSFFDPIATTRELLGADTLYVQSAEDQQGDQGLNVGVGKYLNEKVYLELEYTPDPTQPWKGRIEIELTPRLSLESTVGGKEGTMGTELKWKKDY